jgi:hypothetical protein
MGFQVATVAALHIEAHAPAQKHSTQTPAQEVVDLEQCDRLVYVLPSMITANSDIAHLPAIN